MRKNILKKTLSVALVGAMAAGALSACGNDSATTTAAATEEATDAETEAGDETEAADETSGEDETSGGEVAAAEWEPFADNVTLTVPVYDRGIAGVPDVKDNYWTQWIQENFGDKYNITVEFEPIPRTNQMQTYSNLAASQDLPTLCMEYDFPKLAQWANDGYLTSYDLEEFKSIAPTYYSKMEELGLIQYTTMNDETYFVLAERPYYNTNFNFMNFVRMDWLEEVGYDHVPKTRDEYVDAMTKIQEAGISEHPGGGMMLSGNGADQNDGYRSLPLDETEWAMYGDFSIPALGWEPNYKLLKNANADYNAGITDPEYYITDQATSEANFVNGKNYQYGAYISADMPVLTSFYETNPDAKLAVIPADVTTAETNLYRTDNPFGMMIGFSSQATEDEIKAGMMYLEWMVQEDTLFTLRWGVEGETYNLNEEGLPVSVADYEGEYKQGNANNKDYFCCAVEAVNAGTVEQQIDSLFPNNLPQSDELKEQILEFYNTRVEQAEKGYGISPCLFSTVIQAEADEGTALTELYVSLRDELTMCSPDEFDAKYEEASQEYLDAGYQAVIDERKEAYEAGSSTTLREDQKN